MSGMLKWNNPVDKPVRSPSVEVGTSQTPPRPRHSPMSLPIPPTGERIGARAVNHGGGPERLAGIAQITAASLCWQMLEARLNPATCLPTATPIFFRIYYQ